LAFWDFKFGQKLAEIFTTLYDSAQGIHLELKKIVCYSKKKNSKKAKDANIYRFHEIITILKIYLFLIRKAYRFSAYITCLLVLAFVLALVLALLEL